jgi:hypothetical protein
LSSHGPKGKHTPRFSTKSMRAVQLITRLWSPDPCAVQSWREELPPTVAHHARCQESELAIDGDARARAALRFRVPARA